MVFTDHHHSFLLSFPCHDPPCIILHSSLFHSLSTMLPSMEGARLGGATEEGKSMAALAYKGIHGTCLGRERSHPWPGHLLQGHGTVVGLASELK